MKARPKRKLTAEKIAEVRALAAKGFNQRDIATRSGLSKGTVSSLLAGPSAQLGTTSRSGRVSRDTAPKEAPPPQPSERLDPADEPEADPPADLSPSASLARAAGHLERAAAAALATGDTARLITASKAAAQVAMLIDKLPKPAPTLDERAEMIAAAKQAREKLHDLLDRYLEEPKP